MVDLVKMVRDGKTADVHPLEVENFKKADWVVTEQPKKTVSSRASRATVKKTK